MRFLLKLSGETLLGPREAGIDPETTMNVAKEIFEAKNTSGAEVVIVIGAGNLFRGAKAEKKGMDRVAGDYIGMLATIMNSLALQDDLEECGVETHVMSSFDIPQMAETFNNTKALRYLKKGAVVICAGGTGNPFFSTDSASVLRALELKCDKVLKATKVDGVYDSDPKTNPKAKKYEKLSLQEAIEKNLGVMDQTALAMARENHLPIQVFDFFKKGNLRKVLEGQEIGTIVL